MTERPPLSQKDRMRAERERRLAEALRANLKRRKAPVREPEESGATEPPPSPQERDLE
jgi:hypothetical protein